MFGNTRRKEFGRGWREHGTFGSPFEEGGHHRQRGEHFDDEGGRHRQRRGDIKYILLELLKEQPRHGYDLIKELEQRFGGFYRPSPGSVYPTLQLLEDEGALRSETVDSKRVYTITAVGLKMLEDRKQEQGSEFWPRGFGRNGEQFGDLRRASMALTGSVMQAARFGTPEQVKAVQDLLTKTTQEVHAILAKGPEKL